MSARVTCEHCRPGRLSKGPEVRWAYARRACGARRGPVRLGQREKAVEGDEVGLCSVSLWSPQGASAAGAEREGSGGR